MGLLLNYIGRRLEYDGKGAVLSNCGQYRYVLWRQWNSGKGTAVFVMLNPSTADGMKDDPTIRRCCAFAFRWGFRGVEVVNLCAFRATNPKVLPNIPHPISEPEFPVKNFTFIKEACTQADMIVLAWGKDGIALDESASMRDTLLTAWPGKVYVLGRNKDGSPKHPLYVSGGVIPMSAVPQ